MKLGFSTQLGKTLAEDIEFAEANGFNALCVELTWKPNLNFNKSDVKKLKDFSKKGNFICAHMPFFLYVNTSVNEIFEGVKKYFKKVINFCLEAGITSITFHTGYNEQIGPFKTNKYLIRNIKELLFIAKNKKVDLSIENDDKGQDYPLWSESSIKEVLSEFPDLKFTFDIGHAHTADIDIKEFYVYVKDKTDIIHLHNNTGKDSHNSLDEGDIDIKSFLSKSFDPDKIYILELFPYDKIVKNKRLFEEYIK